MRVPSFLALWVVMLASPAMAGERGSLSAQRKTVFALHTEYTMSQGQRPRFLPESRDFSQNAAWLGLRAGFINERGETSPGGQLGFEAEARLGYTARESDSLRDRTPAGFSLRGSAIIRAYAFNVPVHGALLFVAGGEAGYGGAHWWSNTMRLSPMLGGRAVMRMGEWVHAELEYHFIPHVITGSPRSMEVERMEQRGALRLGVGPVVLGATGALTRESTRNRRRDRVSRSREQRWGVLIELQL